MSSPRRFSTLTNKLDKQLPDPCSGTQSAMLKRIKNEQERLRTLDPYTMQKNQVKEIEHIVTFMSPRYRRRSLKLKPIDFHRKNNVSFGGKTPDDDLGLKYAEN